MKKILTLLTAGTSLFILGACFTSSQEEKREDPIDPIVEDPKDSPIISEKFEDYFDITISREDYTTKPDRSTDKTAYPNYNEAADTVILGLMGGPVYETSGTYFASNENYFDFEYNLLYVNQAQTFIEDELDSSSDLETTQKTANAINNKTISMLNELVTEFSEDGKEVIILGHSYGAFLIPYYISQYGTEDVEIFSAVAGRLNFDGKHEVFYNGGAGYFYESDDINPKYECDGEIDYESLCTVVEDIMALSREDYNEIIEDVSDLTEEEYLELKYAMYITRILQGDLGRHNYIENLTTEAKEDITIDLSKFVYLAGGKDQAVGKFNESEMKFANDNLEFIFGEEEGHGVSGLHQDMADKFKELLDDTSVYVNTQYMYIPKALKEENTVK